MAILGLGPISRRGRAEVDSPRGTSSEEAHSNVAAHSEIDRILIEVEDECGGLPEGKAEQMFRPFEQLGAERTGVGLGLPLSRRGVEANGGKLYVRSVPGIGCMFTVVFLGRGRPCCDGMTMRETFTERRGAPAKEC